MHLPLIILHFPQMTRVGILSDTHGFLDDKILKHLEECDEVWHAGDIGSMEVVEQLEAYKPLKAVYGNIDNHVIRACCAEINSFECEQVNVLIKHIVGYPDKYDRSMKEVFEVHNPGLLIGGHSHILKVMHDKKQDLLFINPGAAGKNGFHNVRTLVRLTIEKSNFKDLEVIELGKR